MTGLVQTSLKATWGVWSSSPLIFNRDSFSLWILAHLQMGGTRPTLTDVTRYFWYTIFITIDVCVPLFYDLCLWLTVCLYMEAVILLMNLWEYHRLFRRVYVHLKPFTWYAWRQGICTVASWKPIVSWRESKFFPFNCQTLGLFLSPQRLYCKVSV